MRINASALESKLGLPGFVEETFLPQVEKATVEAFELASYPTTDHARFFLEPDGTYMTFAAEFLLDRDRRPLLLEFTSFPQVASVLKGHPDVEYIYDNLALSLTDLLLKTAQLPSGPQTPYVPSSGPGWRLVASRDAFPHP